MKFEDITSIAVLGAGVMGNGIAQLAALAGYQVQLFDIKKEALETAKTSIDENLSIGVKKGKLSDEEKQKALQNINFTDKFSDLKVHFVIEAVVERLDVKQKLLQELANINGENCILTSNTSSIPITQIAHGIIKPERVVGMHFFNPAHIMKLVEVIKAADTSDEVANLCKQLAEKMGKTVVMAKDSPGFIVNRVARHFYVESLKIVEDGVADFETVDRQMESLGFKMGPFKLMDLIGVETNFSVTTSMFNSFHQDSKFRPSRIQQQKVDAGHWGRKSGKGFYNY